MARWGRAIRWLPPDAGRVLDDGCAFGFLTRRLARRFPEVAGVDLDPGHVERARRAVPGADIRHGRADALPWPDAHFDAAVCLDVLEHVPDPAAAVAELARVLRPGGVAVVSVPHRGWLAAADSLNVYQRLLPGRTPPTDDPSWAATPHHRHFGVDELSALLGPHFVVERVRRTGTGAGELLHIVLLLVTRALSPRLRPVHAVLQHAYFGLYALDDGIPLGRAGYSVAVRARRRAADAPGPWAGDAHDRLG